MAAVRIAAGLVSVALVAAGCAGGGAGGTTVPETTVPLETTTTAPTPPPETTTTTEAEEAGPTDCPIAPRSQIGIGMFPFKGVEYDGDDRATCEFYQGDREDTNILALTGLRGDAVATAEDDWLAALEVDPASSTVWTVRVLSIAGGEGYLLTHSADGNLSALAFRDGRAAIATMSYRGRVVGQGRPDNVFRAWVELVLDRMADGNW